MLLSNQQKYILEILKEFKYLRVRQLHALVQAHYRTQGIKIDERRMEIMLRQMRTGTNYVWLRGDVVSYGDRRIDPRLLEALDVMLELTRVQPGFYSKDGLHEPFLLRFTGNGKGAGYLFSVAWLDAATHIATVPRMKGERIIWISESGSFGEIDLPRHHFFAARQKDGNRAQASRRQASRSQRRFFAAREDLHAVGSRITCRMLAVGPRRCLVDCYGYDLDMTQREIRYAAIPDLRTEFHPGSEIDCIVKEYHPRTGELIVSAKETEVNPFFGAEERHPVGSRRFAMISGKYGGGVFCNLPDGVTCMCNYSYQHEDADFMVGEHVMLMVQRYDQEKLQMYGKIMSKW